jgi:flagellar basal-body rod protein FlgG
MINQLNRLDQVSNNLANVNTNGFKQEGTTETTFNYYLQKMQNEGKEPSKVNVVTNNVPKIDSKFIKIEANTRERSIWKIYSIESSSIQ